MHATRMDPRRLDGGWERGPRRDDVRRHWERLLHLSRYLDERERVLFESVVEDGGRVGRLARLTGRSPSSLRRHIHDIARRLMGRELHVLLAHPQAFSGLEQACLRDHLVRKHTLTHVADALAISVYEVRKTLAAVRAKAERLWRVEQAGEIAFDAAACRGL